MHNCASAVGIGRWCATGRLPLGCVRRFHLRARVEVTINRPSAPPADPDVPDSGIRLLESRSCGVSQHRVNDDWLRQGDQT